MNPEYIAKASDDWTAALTIVPGLQRWRAQ